MVAEPAAHDQADLGVDLLDPGIGQPVHERRLDPLALFGYPAGELAERFEARSAGPLQPRLEQHERVLWLGAVDLSELLGDQVRAIQALVDLLDRRELELLAVGQVAGFSTARSGRP